MIIATSEDVERELQQCADLVPILSEIRKKSELVDDSRIQRAIIEFVESKIPHDPNDEVEPAGFAWVCLKPLTEINEWLQLEIFQDLISKSLRALTDCMEADRMLWDLRTHLEVLATDQFIDTLAWTFEHHDNYSGKLSQIIQCIKRVPAILDDSRIIESLRARIEDIADGIRNETAYFGDGEGPWTVIERIHDVDFLMIDDRIKAAVEMITDDVIIERLIDNFYDTLPTVANTPLFAKKPRIRMTVAALLQDYPSQFNEIISQSEDLTSCILVRKAIGQELKEDDLGEKEIDAVVSLLDEYEHPWEIIDILKEIRFVWKLSEIQAAIERAIPRIAEAIRREKDLRIIFSLIYFDSLDDSYADPPWVIESDTIKQAIRDVGVRIAQGLHNYTDGAHHSLSLVLLDSGVGQLDFELPRQLSSSSELPKLGTILSLKGWDYITEQLAKRLSSDPSYASELLEEIPIDISYYFNDYDTLDGEFGVRLASLLLDYKPSGYRERMEFLVDLVLNSKRTYEWQEMLADVISWLESDTKLSS